MDYGKYFSADVPSFLRSPVREIFRKVDLSAICSFAGGYPAAETFPVEEIPALSAAVLAKYGPKALQYGATQGVPQLREAIAARYGVPVSQVLITTSSQQGIDICSRVFLNPGDVVLANNPVYLGALQSFKAYRAEVVPLEAARSAVVDLVQGIFGRGSIPGAGPGPSSVASRPLQGNVGGPGPGGKSKPRPKSGWTWSRAKADGPTTAPKFIYVIPDFNNPTGKTLSLEERKAIVRIARELDILIVEDSPYRELRYSGESVTSIRELAPERTLQLGSFSKIFAPGFRLGWIIGPEELLEQIYVCKQCLDLCPPVFDQYLATEFLTSGALDRNLKKTVELYRHRRDKMLALLEKYMPEGVTWTHPEGGLFLWLTLPESIDAVALYDRALDAGVAYVAGSFFYTDGSHRNTMRLNYSFIEEEKMEPGIKLLASLLSPAETAYKFSGAGNDFVVLDGRKADVSAYRQKERIGELCRKYRTDGLMILGEKPGVDFAMEFFNPDGTGGMMCGNGGRCIVAFASMMGIKPASADGIWRFQAPDGLHEAQILQGGEILPHRSKWTVRLKMIDVEGVRPMMGGYFLNTGTRHFVKFVRDVEGIDMEKDGPEYRWDEAFQPEGANANFVQVAPDGLHVRTFEKGVEAETLACGTGITASAVAACYAGIPGAAEGSYRLQCRRGDWLQVDFNISGEKYTDVYLTGPAEMVKTVKL
ncbi:MAG: diaminopimelate epimerase [Bacteroidales bacterium]|nr:diaminopimelate epimerase [Bacteroidales bacterium]